MKYVEPIIITRDKVKLIIEINNDIVTIQYYFKDELVDSIMLPHTNSVVDFIAKQTGFKENTVRRYIYKNRREEFIKNKLITFQNDTMHVLDIEKLIKTLKKEL